MFNQPYYQPIRNEIIHVNGENGARALQMMPNSQALLLDDTAPIVWLAQTDGAGYKTITAYDIVLHVPEKPIDIKSLEERIDKLERMMENAKSDAGRAKQKPKHESAD